MPTLSTSSLIVIRRLSKIITSTASMFSSVVDALGHRHWHLLFKPVIPQLNLYSAHSRLAKHHRQHLNSHLISFFTQDLISFFGSCFSNSKESKSIPNLIQDSICRRLLRGSSPLTFVWSIINLCLILFRFTSSNFLLLYLQFRLTYPFFSSQLRRLSRNYCEFIELCEVNY